MESIHQLLYVGCVTSIEYVLLAGRMPSIASVIVSFVDAYAVSIITS